MTLTTLTLEVDTLTPMRGPKGVSRVNSDAGLLRPPSSWGFVPNPKPVVTTWQGIAARLSSVIYVFRVSRVCPRYLDVGACFYCIWIVL